MTIKFIDKNERLVKKVAKAVEYLPFKVQVSYGDIFRYEGVIVSASNPDFGMGVGLDALIAKKYPKEVELVRITKKQQQIGDVMFVVTVDKDIKATRESVAKALKFALDKKNHLKKNQTMLVSGLGTGIGGLDEDDFVWLFLQAVCEANGYGWGIKFTKQSGYSYYVNEKTNKPVKYTVGKWVEELDALKDGAKCGHGLHLGKDFIGAGNYGLPINTFFCLYDNKDVCGEGSDKIRVRRLLTVARLPKWLGYGPNGNKLLAGLKKGFYPEKYNPYQATKLPSIKDFKPFSRSLSQVWGQVRGQVRDQVWGQVGDQVGTASYWALNIYFNLGISHWLGEFLKLGVMVIFVNGKVKVFGKKGKYLGEYDESEIINQ